MKQYTLRFRCRSHLEDDDTVNEEKYEMQVEAENLKGVCTKVYMADGCRSSRDDFQSILIKTG